MRRVVLEVSVLILAAACFVVMHEAGHFIAADMIGLNPRFVMAEPSANFLFYRVGVAFQETTVPMENMLILLGALIPPLVLGTFLYFSKNYYIKLFAIVFLALGVVAFLPLPLGETDANIMYAILMG